MKKNNKLIISTVLIFCFSLILICVGIIFLYKENAYKYKDNYLDLKTSEIEYIVKKEDTLDFIAYKYNISLDKLKKYNKLDSDIIEGNKIKIPNVSIYKLRDEKNISEIEKRFKVSSDILVKVNNLKNNDISNLEEIIIPNIIVHKVKKGEDINKISKKYNISGNSILKFNKITKNDIVKGFNIVIPNSSFLGYETNENISDLSSLEDILYNKILFIGEDLYKSKKYLNLNKSNTGAYYITLEELINIDKDLSKLLEKCNKNHKLIYFDDTKEEPLAFNFIC